MIHILSDSTCDLSPELVSRYSITILPLHVLLGETEFEDGVSITPDEIYAWSDANKSTPKTSAPSPASAEDALKKLLTSPGDEVVAFCISESMSTSGNVIRMAADLLDASDRVHVIDSRNLSTGIGHLVVEAAIMAQEGLSAAEIVSRIEALRPRVRASFVVDTLVYLYRGGRCSGAAALAGSVLKLHPLIAVTDGAMAPGTKYRGPIRKVIMQYAKDLEPQLKTSKKDRVFITHSGCSEEIITSVMDYLKSLDRFDEILVTRAGGVVSSHCGPNTLGVLFIEGDN